MCANCSNSFKDCSKLDFKSMHKLIDYGDVIVAKCTEYQQRVWPDASNFKDK